MRPYINLSAVTKPFLSGVVGKDAVDQLRRLLNLDEGNPCRSARTRMAVAPKLQSANLAPPQPRQEYHVRAFLQVFQCAR